MSKYTVQWYHKCKSHWPSEPDRMMVCAGWQSQKLGLKSNVEVLFWEILVRWSKAEERTKMPTKFLENSSIGH